MEAELAESIATVGLLHPPVVRQGYDGSYTLVAGERRYRAMASLVDYERVFWAAGSEFPVPAGMIPVSVITSLSDPILIEEAELDENLKRKDLTWQERAEATARLASLRARAAALSSLPTPTTATIAAEVERPVESVRVDLLVAKHLSDPVVRGMKTAGDALKHLKRAEVREKMTLKAASIASAPTPLSQRHRLLKSEALSFIKSQPPASYDVVCADPPYGMGADTFNDGGGAATAEHFYDDSLDVWEALMTALAPELYRVTKADAHVYLFCDLDRFADLKARLTAAGFRVHRTPILWLKPNGARVPWPESGPRRAYELILYAIKGTKPITHLENDYVLCAPDKNLGHSAQKPVELLRNLLARSVHPGDSVLDPFCGSGGIFPAGHALSCFVTGCDQDAASIGLAATRIEGLS
jgi:site-specific DNA-methyltransferase (adenine-specific)